jgi:DNA-binding CsgD family transcriptional regulator
MQTLTPTPRLSPREIEVVELVVDGHPNKIIADKLGMSAHTAKFHVKNLMRKLRAGSRAHVAAQYLRLNKPACAECRARELTCRT